MSYEEELQAAIDQDARKLEQMVDARQRRIDKAIGYLTQWKENSDDGFRNEHCENLIDILEGNA
jgi:hypothetical protein